MISKFANTQYIVEEYRKKACNYIIANYFVDGLMDQSSEPKKWNDYVALFKEENLAGNIKPATVSTILELLKTHLRYRIYYFLLSLIYLIYRLLFYQMYNELQQYEVHRGKIEFYTWDLSKRFNDLTDDNYLFERFRMYDKPES